MDCICEHPNFEIHYRDVYFSYSAKLRGIPDEKIYLGMTCRICNKPRKQSNKMNKAVINNIQTARNEAITAALKLKEALKPIEVSINKLVADKGKPLDQMSLTDTVNVANLIINLFADQPE